MPEKQKFKKVDLDKWHPQGETNGYDLSWFELLTFRETKVVIYGVGQWDGHMMDWRGCNFFHGRLPLSPVFNNTEEATAWLKFQVENKVYTEGMWLTGHSRGENRCSKGCDDREIDVIYFIHLRGKKE